ncbi:hypothetical protein GY45DRAFT_1321406 [Cubamyces sp. BRFM 1775]|nr:hypothetical protein GY45DRAFT_1321406 [Cubamyces sp. BRFM 1775]
MTSGTERAHAFETVDAYCTTHDLHLAAVFVLSATAPAPLKPAISGRTDVSAWAKTVRQCLVDPITVVQDYAPLLATASGRVVVLLASGDQEGMGSAHLVTLESAAQFLRQQLGTLDIRVATVSTGPFARMSRPLAPTGSDASRTLAWGQRVEECGSGIRSAIGAASQHFFVRYEDVWTICHNIVRLRYPRERYTIGLHAGLRDVFAAVPTAFRLRFCSHSSSRPPPR